MVDQEDVIIPEALQETTQLGMMPLVNLIVCMLTTAVKLVFFTGRKAGLQKCNCAAGPVFADATEDTDRSVHSRRFGHSAWA